ncbi:MAG: redoxin domain-containing protein [Bacteroidales bacterium]|nr:redoxin domain-containing protein [Bacteroidales bacterium]
MLRLISLPALILLFYFAAIGQNPTTIQVGSEEFYQLISEGEGVLLDVRTEREFQNGHIENSGQLNFYARDFRQSLLLLPKDQPVYLYCNTGWRSNIAASYLIRNGYTKVYNLEHGIMEWEQADFPVTIDPDAQPETDDQFLTSEFNALIHQDELVFIDFYAPWCGPCRQMMPMIDSLTIEYKGRVNIVKINADASKRLMRDIQLVSVPYLVLYQNGKILFEHKGMIEEQELVAILESHYNSWKNGK